MTHSNLHITFTSPDLAGQELAGLLRQAADKLEEGRTRVALLDDAGRLVGSVSYNSAEQIEKNEKYARLLIGE